MATLSACLFLLAERTHAMDRCLLAKRSHRALEIKDVAERTQSSSRKLYRALRMREAEQILGFHLFRNVLGEYPDSDAFDGGTGVEQVGCDLLDGVSMGQELCLPGGTRGAPYAGKFVHRGVTDLTFDRFAVVKHRKPERQSFEVVSLHFASRQRHRNIPQRFV